MGEEIDAGDDSAILTTMQDFMRLFIEPEVIRRQQLGELADPFELRAAQILWFPEGRAPIVRLNDEVRALMRVEFCQPIDGKVGDPVYRKEIKEILEVRLTDDDDPNAGFATLLRTKDNWVLSLDCHYNKGRAFAGLERAHQFLLAAERAHDEAHWAVFFDTLFSAMELAARAELLLAPLPTFIATNHNAIRAEINKQLKLGNVSKPFVKTFNKLSEARRRARYSHDPVAADKSECAALLRLAKEEIAGLRASQRFARDQAA